MNAAVQRYHFEPGTLIEYDGFSVVVAGFGKAGLIVRDRFVGEDETPRYFVLSDAKVQEILGRYDVVIDADFSKDGSSDFDEPNIGQVGISWGERTDDQRKVALQRESWCLATKAVLKIGPFHTKQIEDNYVEIQARALDRQRLNALGTDKNGKFEGRTWGPKSVDNYCATYLSMRVPHPNALVGAKLVGNTTSVMSSAENALLDRCCENYLNRAQPSKASIVRYVRQTFDTAANQRRLNGDMHTLSTPHQNTIYRRLSKFTRLALVISREGYKAAQKEFSPTQHGVRALKPGELIELDFWKGDVFTFSQRA